MDDLRGERNLWCTLIRMSIENYRRNSSPAALEFLRSQGVRYVMDALGLPTDAMLREIGYWR